MPLITIGTDQFKKWSSSSALRVNLLYICLITYSCSTIPELSLSYKLKNQRFLRKLINIAVSKNKIGCIQSFLDTVLLIFIHFTH